MKRATRRLLIAVCIAAAIGCGVVGGWYHLRGTDEVVTLFPTIARPTADGRSWELRLHGWVYEPELGSIWRRAALKAFAKRMGLKPDSPENATFRARATMFLVDNERGKTLTLRIGGTDVTLPRTAANGHTEHTATVATTEVDRASLAAAGPRARWLTYHLRHGGARYSGRVLLVPPTGVSVVSDIDDTVKVTGVKDKQAMMRRTFLQPFEWVKGMPEVYRGWSDQGALFHYVSSSPWQLYPALSESMRTAGLPAGSFHLKRFRLKDRTGLALLGGAHDNKRRAIADLLTWSPRRELILVGDSGEHDPEIYGALAKDHLARIRHVFIRNVSGEKPTDARFVKAFAGVPHERWTLFEDPAVLAKFPVKAD